MESPYLPKSKMAGWPSTGRVSRGAKIRPSVHGIPVIWAMLRRPRRIPHISPDTYAENVGPRAPTGCNAVSACGLGPASDDPLAIKTWGRVKGGHQAANSAHLRRLRTPHLRATSPHGGAPLGRCIPQLYIAGWVGDRRCPKTPRVSILGRASGGRRIGLSNGEGGALLDSRCRGRRGECRRSPLDTYAA